MTTRDDDNLRRASNLFALSLASYREGEVDGAFDLFIEACEVRVGDATSELSREVCSLIHEALAEAEATQGRHYGSLVSDSDDEDYGVLESSDLLDEQDAVTAAIDADVVAANLAELDAA